MIRHELWHYFFDLCEFNINKDKDIQIFYVIHTRNILISFHTVKLYTGKDKREEFIIRAFYRFEEGALSTITDDEKWNLELFEFIKEKYELLKLLIRGKNDN